MYYDYISINNVGPIRTGGYSGGSILTADFDHYTCSMGDKIYIWEQSTIQIDNIGSPSKG